MKQLRRTELKRYHRAAKRAMPKPEQQIVLFLQSVEDAVNVGSVFRIADAVRAEKVILTGITPRPPDPRIGKSSRFKEKEVAWEYYEKPQEAIKALKEEGYTILALEITDQSHFYYEVEYPEKTCLVVGHEEFGVHKSVLDLCDGAVFIPMFGKGKSLNVHVSLAVLCYHLREQELNSSQVDTSE
jgi:23S rRNA (guanosine2251-2'-O)-methyltransferase